MSYKMYSRFAVHDKFDTISIMKWLKFEGSENRDKVLTIRTTNTCMKRIKQLIDFVKKEQDLKISQSDLLERLVEEAWNEMNKSKKRGRS